MREKLAKLSPNYHIIAFLAHCEALACDQGRNLHNFIGGIKNFCPAELDFALRGINPQCSNRCQKNTIALVINISHNAVSTNNENPHLTDTKM